MSTQLDIRAAALNLWNRAKSVVWGYWIKERDLEYIDGILTIDSLFVLLKRVKKNLRSELTELYLDFLKQRKKAEETEYEQIVFAFREKFREKKEEAILETIKGFGLNEYSFKKNLEKWAENEKVLDYFQKIENVYIKSPGIVFGIDQLNVILMTQEYISSMQEQLEISNRFVERFKILDRLSRKYGITEMDLYLGYKLHREHPAIYEMKNLVFTLEESFNN